MQRGRPGICLAALIGDGGWDVLSAVTLGIPVLVCLWYGVVRKPRRS